jgi:hypothetical protein
MTMYHARVIWLTGSSIEASINVCMAQQVIATTTLWQKLPIDFTTLNSVNTQVDGGKGCCGNGYLGMRGLVQQQTPSQLNRLYHNI